MDSPIQRTKIWMVEVKVSSFSDMKNKQIKSIQNVHLRKILKNTHQNIKIPSLEPPKNKQSTFWIVLKLEK